jgi:hypothetical protein
MLIEIQKDIYFINSRLKELDKDYQIYFNTKKDKFEVHNEEQIGGSYCLTVPYSLLDERTVNLVRKTRIENRKKLFAEIERDNENLETIKEKRILDSAKDQLYDVIKYSKIN